MSFSVIVITQGTARVKGARAAKTIQVVFILGGGDGRDVLKLHGWMQRSLVL